MHTINSVYIGKLHQNVVHWNIFGKWGIDVTIKRSDFLNFNIIIMTVCIRTLKMVKLSPTGG